MRLKFWMWVHDTLEKCWHWVYRHKVVPLQNPWPEYAPIVYSEVFRNEEVIIYRTGGNQLP